ncbi:2-C-methyl-D-erythritol 4-phosphate cytidylyltransferase [Clostridium saudiense]|nr:2-C-methyl-D-erythritol 4-phosphate cytidylyltransferase [Clostridium saudiense]
MTSVIILAGGKGKRMESTVSKQFIEIKDKPILYYTLKKFIGEKLDVIVTSVLQTAAGRMIFAKQKEN